MSTYLFINFSLRNSKMQFKNNAEISLLFWYALKPKMYHKHTQRESGSILCLISLPIGFCLPLSSLCLTLKVRGGEH